MVFLGIFHKLITIKIKGCKHEKLMDNTAILTFAGMILVTILGLIFGKL